MNKHIKEIDLKIEDLLTDGDEQRQYQRLLLKEHEIETEIKESEIKGKIEGEIDGKISVAINLKNSGMPIDEIVKVTELSKEIIEDL